MKKRVFILALVALFIFSIFPQAEEKSLSQAANEAVHYLDFSLDGGIVEAEDSNSVYKWTSDGDLLMPTGVNQSEIKFSYNDENKALQIDFDGAMETNLSCLWISLSEAYEVSPENSYYLAIKYKYMKENVTGFLSRTQLLVGYSSVGTWSEADSGGRILKSLTAAGMPILQDGDWLVAVARISFNDRITTINYNEDKFNIKVIRTSLEESISNESVLLKSISIFEDHSGLSELEALTEENIKDLRITAPVYFSMKNKFDTVDEIAFSVDDEHLASYTYQEKTGDSWQEIEGKPSKNGEYRLELVLNKGYYFQKSFIGVSDEVEKGILHYGFTVGEIAEETPSTKTQEPTSTNGASNNDGEKDKNSGNIGLIIAIISAIIIIAVIAFIIYKRKNKA